MPMAPEHTTAVFAAELILLLLVGRMLGEGMSRLGQPAIFGQLLAGVVLGPSVFGALVPEIRHVIFPDTPALKSMVDAISQIGILLLLLLTGIETNLELVKRRRRTVISTSLLGIAVPFACGVGLAFALPQGLMPNPAAQLVTALFLGTALSISSVKIVAMVLMEVGAKGYDLVFIGIEHPIAASADQFDHRLQKLVETFDGPLAIVLNREDHPAEPDAPLKILVPTGGTPAAGLAIEMALALARASNGPLTVLHVFDPQDDTALLRNRARRQGLSLLAEARRLGERNDVPIKTIYVTHASPETAIQRAARAGRYDLVVVGTSLREGATKFLGPRSSALLRNLDSPTLLVTH